MGKIAISEGTIITFYGISWNDGWEFDAPSIITSPGYFYSDSYAGLSGLIEEICIDAAVESEISFEEEVFESEWRGWKVEQFDQFIKDLFNKKETVLPDYFQEFKKEIETVYIIKQTVQFKWNDEYEWYDYEDIEIVEKAVDLNLINEKN